MAGIQGLRGTGQFTNDFRPKNYRELFSLLEPNGNSPLNSMLAMTGSEATDDPSYKNFRDELPNRALTVNGAVASASTTTLTVDAGNDNLFAVAGSIIVNAQTGEVMRTTADASATGLVVERNIGGTNHQIADGADLFIAGTAYEEGANSPTGVSFDATVSENFTQIFRTAFTVTETLRATNLRTGDKEDEMATKALKMHMMDIERAMFFGKKNESAGSTAQPRRFTGGLINTLSNVIDRSSASNTMTEDQFDRSLIEDIFAFGSKQKIMFCGAKVAGHLQKFGKDRWSPHVIDDTYGVSLTGYETFAGTLAVHLHPQFRMVPGMENAAVIVDFPYLKYRYMEGRDTSLLRDRQSPDADAVKHEYLTECGLELLQDKVHTYIKNWDAIA
jgi:flagellar hook-basal body complex protein FliE